MALMDGRIHLEFVLPITFSFGHHAHQDFTGGEQSLPIVIFEREKIPYKTPSSGFGYRAARVALPPEGISPA
jgi:hypothetical protein